jgi:hypothetical protein
MRTIGHKVDAKLLRDDYKYYSDELEESTAGRAKQKRARNVEFFVGHVRLALNVARTGYLFGAPYEEIVDVLKSGLRELVVALELGATLSPIAMRDYLGAALLTGDKALIKWLSELPKADYTDSGIKVSEAGYTLVQTIQAGMKGDEKTFRARASKFLAASGPGKPAVVPGEKSIYQPLALMLQAIAEKDEAAFAKAWRDQAASWQKRFGRPAERANMDGLLDFEALGIARIAQRWGLAVPETNPYAPVALLDAGEQL